MDTVLASATKPAYKIQDRKPTAVDLKHRNLPSSVNNRRTSSSGNRNNYREPFSDSTNRSRPQDRSFSPEYERHRNHRDDRQRSYHERSSEDRYPSSRLDSNARKRIREELLEELRRLRSPTPEKERYSSSRRYSIDHPPTPRPRHYYEEDRHHRRYSYPEEDRHHRRYSYPEEDHHRRSSYPEENRHRHQPDYGRDGRKSHSSEYDRRLSLVANNRYHNEAQGYAQSSTIQQSNSRPMQVVSIPQTMAPRRLMQMDPPQMPVQFVRQVPQQQQQQQATNGYYSFVGQDHHGNSYASL